MISPKLLLLVGLCLSWDILFYLSFNRIYLNSVKSSEFSSFANLFKLILKLDEIYFSLLYVLGEVNSLSANEELFLLFLFDSSLYVLKFSITLLLNRIYLIGSSLLWFNDRIFYLSDDFLDEWFLTELFIS